jgi:protein-S-isoprenylcysteine O-methyltransferase Ste14
MSPVPAFDWMPLLPGIALWALALYLPLSLPLGRFEASLQDGPLDAGAQQLVLVIASLALALAVGVAVQLALCWALGPGWASSLGLMAVLAGLSWGLLSRASRD